MGGILAGGVPLPIDDVVVDGLDEPELGARDLLDPAGVEETALFTLRASIDSSSSRICRSLRPMSRPSLTDSVWYQT